MPTPDYVLQLRRLVGHDLLFLPGVSGVVVREVAGHPQVLLERRADSGEWTLPSGIVEPFEQPADGLAREVAEETGVEVRVDRLALLVTDPELQYPNGDRCCYVSMTFRCTYLAGDAAVADEESSEVGWFGLDALPPLSARMRRRLQVGLPAAGETVFEARAG
ncbi:MAG: NUDIX hydrolase [Actinomycetes bacterium]